MTRIRAHIAMSLDGYAAGPEQSLENPLGKGGEQLHEWAFALDAWRAAHGREGGETNPSSAVVEESTANVGAYVMGRNMFGGGPGPWGDEQWDGWWGDDPPFHAPVFVVTHHAREAVEKEGGTTFHFVTAGVEAAVEQARAAAGDRDVSVGGGATTIQQILKAGLLDELRIDLVPIILGGGTRLVDDLTAGSVSLEIAKVVDAPGVTHLSYRLVR